MSRLATKVRKGGWIQTATGRQVFPLDMEPEEIDLRDIAHALGNLCRWTGHCRTFYSVAQHSVLVSEVVPSKFALWGLLHDATEAYLGDMARSLKGQSDAAWDVGRQYREAEERLMAKIAARFHLDGVIVPEPVREVDYQLLLWEARDLMGNPVWAKRARVEAGITLPPMHIVPLKPAEATRAFLDRYAELVG